MRLLLLSVLMLTAAAPIVAGPAAIPAVEPVVTTIIERHPGNVGGLIVDQLGYVYVADFGETVWRVDPNTRQVEAWARGLYGSSGNTFDAHGNLYQSNFFGNYVSKISRDGRHTVVVRDNLSGPVGLTFGDSGELFICSCHDKAIRRADPEGNVTTFATSEHFVCPNGITRDSEGNLYVVSFSNPKVIKISPDGESSVFADSGGRGLGHITQLRGVFYATSFWDNKVYRITRDGEIALLAGTGERAQRDGPAATAQFSNPNGIYPDGTGTYLYINDYVGDPNAAGTAITPFSIRRIELPNLSNILEYELRNNSLEHAKSSYKAFMAEQSRAGEDWRAPLDSLGWELMMDGLIEEAVTVFELNVDSSPGWWRAHRSLGMSYVKVGKEPEAIEAFRRALEINPGDADVTRRLKRLEAD